MNNYYFSPEQLQALTELAEKHLVSQLTDNQRANTAGLVESNHDYLARKLSETKGCVGSQAQAQDERAAANNYVDRKLSQANKVNDVPDSLEGREFYWHPLHTAFADAWKQATQGKGQRHGGAVKPFYEQAWLHIANAQGTGFLTGQAAKKLQELGERLVKGNGSQIGDEAWQRELLGALVYLGMAYLHGTGMAPGSPSKLGVSNAVAAIEAR